MNSATASENDMHSPSSRRTVERIAPPSFCTCDSVSSGTMSMDTTPTMHEGNISIGSTIPCIMP